MATLTQRFGTKQSAWKPVASSDGARSVAHYFLDGEDGVSITLNDPAGHARFDVFLTVADIDAIIERREALHSRDGKGIAGRKTVIVIQFPDGQYASWDGEKDVHRPNPLDSGDRSFSAYVKDANPYASEGAELVEMTITARPTGRKTAELLADGEYEA